MSLSSGQVELLRGEEPCQPPERVTFLSHDGQSEAVTVCLTQWRLLLFCPGPSWLHAVPITAFHGVEYLTSSRANVLKLQCKHFGPSIELLVERSDSRLQV